MPKIYISIYAPKATHISNLYHKLTQYSEKVNNESHNNSLDFHLTKRDIFNSNLDNQYVIEEYIILNTLNCLNISYI